MAGVHAPRASQLLTGRRRALGGARHGEIRQHEPNGDVELLGAPLPPAGKLAFVCEWPAAGIPLTRHEIDAQIILDAASHAQQLFTDEELFDTPGGHGITIG